MFAGTGLLDRDIILVSINYRLNAFGFFTLDINESPGNLGLLDQLWALSWVKRNIQHFGGNPDMITIYGQSAGAASVGYLMDTNLTRGLFHRAIQSSGDSSSGWTVNRNAYNQSLSFSAALGCTSEDMAVPSIQLNDSVQEQYRIVPNDPINNIPEKTRAGVPLLIGTNKNDGSVILSRWAWSAIVWNETHNDFLRYKLLQDLLTSANFELKDYPTGTIEILISSFLKEMRLPDSFTGVAPFISDIYSAFYFKAPALSKAKSHAQLGWDTFLYSHEYFNP
ncbi:Carboxylesterase 5A [Folsomia candida]|uniref:Carboxylic ester hydrolase n=1 Tax=Folsomia candida TaxID=158441 RepID=A0A226D2U1_FOLCA|nr:Carboxylesterase 5A [Folsomia candida]